uniref:Uncharacterized protein n=1 Tax=Arundo donax TaxID=35708 RepID=A0A0A9D575_ARUDO
MLTPSPPKRTRRLPTAQALKLHREGSTCPPTVNFLHEAASRVVSSLARRPHPNILVLISSLTVTSLPHAFWQTIFLR